MLLVVQLLPRELGLHGEDQVAGVALHQAQLPRAEDAGLDGRVHVDHLPVLAGVGLEDDGLGLLVVAVARVGANAVGEGLAHALVELELFPVEAHVGEEGGF